MLKHDRCEAADPVLDARVFSLLEAAAAPTEPGPLPGEAEALAAFRSCHAPGRRHAWLSSLLSARAATAAALSAGILVTGGIGAAAAGSLPGAAQDKASELLSRVGVTVPAADATVAGTDERDSSRNAEIAELAEDADAAGGSGVGESGLPAASEHGRAVAELAKNEDLHGAEKGAVISELASDGRSREGGDRAASEDGRRSTRPSRSHGRRTSAPRREPASDVARQPDGDARGHAKADHDAGEDPTEAGVVDADPQGSGESDEHTERS